MKVEVDFPEEVYHRLEKNALQLGLSPAMTVIFHMAIEYRTREEQQQVIMTPFGPAYAPGHEPPTQPPTAPTDDQKFEREMVARNQRMYSMNIASLLLSVGTQTGKTRDEIWQEFEAYYSQIQEKMVRENNVDGLIGDGGPETPKA